MIIKHLSHHGWEKMVTEDPLEGLSPSIVRKLRPSLAKLPDTISYTIAPLSEETLAWFTPLYSETISTKDNPLVFDIAQNTLHHYSGRTYFALTVFEGGTPLGATIFSLRKTYLSIAYRVFKNSWLEAKLQTTPSFYAEYLITQHAWELGFKKLSHGRDRNLYGINSSIGLAIFKLSIGCKARPARNNIDVLELNTTTLDSDVLVIEYTPETEYLQKGFLISSEENFEKYKQVTKYPEQLDVTIIYR